MADNPIVVLLGDKVQKKSNGGSLEDVQVATLKKEGGVLGLYFSAHWCPPCRMFTPELAKFYQNFKKTANGDKFEIVFVSSDRDQDSFDGYFKEMPWLALPFDLRDKKKELGAKYKVTGIPTLVFLDSNTGEEITTNGRGIVTEDPKGEKFPWTSK